VAVGIGAYAAAARLLRIPEMGDVISVLPLPRRGEGIRVGGR